MSWGARSPHRPHEMPPPGFGKGNAFRRDMGINEKFVELSRKSAQMLEAARSQAFDQEGERTVLDVITSSALASERKKVACVEVRKALKLCRQGIDPREEKTLTVCGNAGCSHEHRFLCRTRTRVPTQPEKGIAESVWKMISEQLRAARAILQPLVRVYGSNLSIVSATMLRGGACVRLCARAVEWWRRGRGQQQRRQ